MKRTARIWARTEGGGLRVFVFRADHDQLSLFLGFEKN